MNDMKLVARSPWAVKSVWAVLGLLMCTAVPAAAQPFNIDYGTDFGAPANTYGGAASQPGFWNSFASGANTPTALSGLAGNATAVTVTVNPARAGFSFDNPGTTGNDQALMDDGLDLGAAGGGATVFTFTGLAAGNYTIFTYAWAPDDSSFVTTVSIAGANEGAQTVGGAWPGSQQLGVTFARHTLTLAAGNNIVVTATPTSGFGTLNGFQIVTAVAVPEPTTLATVGMGLVGGVTYLRRRRRKQIVKVA